MKQELLSKKNSAYEDYKSPEASILESSSEKLRLVNNLTIKTQALLQLKINEENSKIEPITLPESDPYPVKTGRNMLIETSFEEKESNKSDESLIGYQHHKDNLVEKIDHAIHMFKEKKEIEQKFRVETQNKEDKEVMNSMRKEAKEAILQKSRHSLSLSKLNSKKYLQKIVNKVKTLNKFLLPDSHKEKAKSKKKKKPTIPSGLSNYDHTKDLREFQNRGIFDKKFISMIKSTKEDLKGVNNFILGPISRLEHHKKSESLKSYEMESWSTRSQIKSRLMSSMSRRSQSSFNIGNLMQVYMAHRGQTDRRRGLKVAFVITSKIKTPNCKFSLDMIN